MCCWNINKRANFVLQRYTYIATGFPVHNCLAILNISRSDLFFLALMSTFIYFLMRLSIQKLSMLFVIFCLSSVSNAKCVFSINLPFSLDQNSSHFQAKCDCRENLQQICARKNLFAEAEIYAAIGVCFVPFFHYYKPLCSNWEIYYSYLPNKTPLKNQIT